MWLLMFSLASFYGGLWTMTDSKAGMVLKPSHRKLFLANSPFQIQFSSVPHTILLHFTRIITCDPPTQTQKSFLLCQEDSNLPPDRTFTVQDQNEPYKLTLAGQQTSPIFPILGRTYLLMNESLQGQFSSFSAQSPTS